MRRAALRRKKKKKEFGTLNSVQWGKSLFNGSEVEGRGKLALSWGLKEHEGNTERQYSKIMWIIKNRLKIIRGIGNIRKVNLSLIQVAYRRHCWVKCDIPGTWFFFFFCVPASQHKRKFWKIQQDVRSLSSSVSFHCVGNNNSPAVSKSFQDDGDCRPLKL